jgi:hypothetical protein
VTYDALVFPFPHDEQTVPVRIRSELWTRLLKAAEANGALILDRYSPAEARAFARAVRAALEPPPPTAEAPRRYAVFVQPRSDPGGPLRDPEVRGDVEAVLGVFEKGAVLVQGRATPSALRALPERGVAGAGQVGRKLQLARPAPAP